MVNSACKENKRLIYVLGIFFVFIFGFTLLIGFFINKDILSNPLFFQDKNDWCMDFFNLNYFACETYDFADNNPPFTEIIALLFVAIAGGKQKYLTLGAKGIRSTSLGIFSLVIFYLLPFIIVAIALKFSKYKRFLPLFFVFTLFVMLPSFIFIYEINRGNYILYALLFVVLFLLFYQSEYKIKRELSYIFLAFAGAIKIYPLIFGIFIIKKKDWLGFFKIILYFLVCFTVSFGILRGGYTHFLKYISNIFSYLFNPQIFQGTIHTNISYDTSIKSFLSILIWIFAKINFVSIYTNSAFNYISIILTILLFLILVICSLLVKNTFITLLICSICIAILPSPSFYYTNLFIYIPLFYLLVFKRKNLKNKYMFCLLFYLTPVTFGYMVRPGSYLLDYGVTNDLFIRQLINLAIIIFIVRDCIRLKVSNENQKN